MEAAMLRRNAIAGLWLLAACGTESADPTIPCSGPLLQIVRKDPSGHAQRLVAGAAVHAGDIVQVGYMRANPHQYGSILSLDGWGVVTVHLPGPDESTAAPLMGTHWLEYAFVLDNAPSFEHFVFVVDDEPFDVGEVQEALRTGALQGDDRVAAQFRLRKE